MNSIKIVELLTTGKEEKAFTKLYRLYPKVEKHICANSGSKNEAQDIFQEGLIVLYNKAETLADKTSISAEGYLVNTCKLLWSNELRKKKVRQKSSDSGLSNMPHKDDIQAQIERESKFKIIEEIFHQLEEKCKKILELFYFKSFSMEQIAKKFGYKAVQSAKAKKYKCMEHARKLASSKTVNP